MIAIIEFFTKLLGFLPNDPFVGYLGKLDEALAPYMGYLNWVIPFEKMLAVTVAWGGVVITSKALLMFYNVLIKKISS